MIGDKSSDMFAAAAAGIGKKLLLASDEVCMEADAVCHSLAEIHAIFFP
jgi:hypothetical protein